MKITTFFTLMVSVLFSSFLASCLGDDNDTHQLTDAEKAQCLNYVRGDYDGDLIYPAQNPDVSVDQTDTIEVSWRIEPSDTSLTVYGFPAELIANALDRSEVKEALLKAPNTSVKSKIYFYQLNPIIGFEIYPEPVTYHLIYGGGSHKLQAYFYSGTFTFGMHSSVQKKMAMQYRLAAIYLDDNKEANLMKDNVFYKFTSQW